MADTLDALLVGAGAYYATTKLQESDDDFSRMVIGAAVGIPAALKGPEAYEAAREYINDRDQLDAATKNKITSSLLFGAGGYAFGDKLLDGDEPQYQIEAPDE